MKIRMIRICIFGLGLFAWTQSIAETNVGLGAKTTTETWYDWARSEFQKAKIPQPAQMIKGWHSGRCWTQRQPEIEKSGLLVIDVKTGTNGQTEIIQSLAASSIREPANFFDHIDPYYIEEYKELTYIDKNHPIEEKDGSYYSQLFYDILIGDLYVRQDGLDLWLTMTGINNHVDDEGAGVFYCRFVTEPLPVPMVRPLSHSLPLPGF